jgi:hypothetical protein
MFTGPKIITDNLMLYLDISNIYSYPGSGTTIYDLSSNNRNLLLNGGVSFDSFNGGNLALDGINGHISCTSYIFPRSAFSYDIWIKPSANDSLKIFWMQELQMFFHANANQVLTRWYNNDITQNTYTRTLSQSYISKWVNITWTVGSYIDIVYINGEQIDINRNTTINNPTITGYNSAVNHGFYVGRDEEAIYRQFNISSIKIYSKILTANEVKQNYNSVKKKFGL